ncbi:MAG: DUF3392 family protein [Lentisphaerota bacterium]
MEFSDPFMKELFRFIRGHLMEIMLAYSATVLSVYGGDINNAVKKKIRKYNFFIRFGIFVALCTFGFGFLTLLIGKILVAFMSQLSNAWLISTIAGLFILIGLIAEERKHI